MFGKIPAFLLVVFLLMSLVFHFEEPGEALSRVSIGSDNVVDLEVLVGSRLAELTRMLEQSPGLVKGFFTMHIRRLKETLAKRDYSKAFRLVSFLASTIELEFRGYLSRFQADLLRLGLSQVEGAMAMLFTAEQGREAWLCVGEYHDGEEVLTVWPQLSDTPHCLLQGFYCHYEKPDTRHYHYSLTDCKCFAAGVPTP